MARDGYMPRQMMNLGDRLVYANGIVMLAGLAIGLIVGFQGDVTRLIPLYAVGVFAASRSPSRGWWCTGCATAARPGATRRR